MQASSGGEKNRSAAAVIWKGRCNMNKNSRKWFFICGLIGCLCFGGGDWLMLYGNPDSSSALSWLTEGVTHMPSWRLTLAMAVSFPGIFFYGIALFSMEQDITDERKKKVYHYLNAFGLTPWLCLHLFYIIILAFYAQLCQAGYAEEAGLACEAVFSQFSWVVLVSEAVMLPVFVYWFILQIRGWTVYPKWMAFTNVLFIFVILKGVTILMPVSAFRLGFTNGLMSESMVIWFSIHLVYLYKRIAKA